MNRDPFARVKELFHAARTLDPTERGAFLDEQCGDDQVLRAEVSDLLAHAASVDDDFLTSLPEVDSAAPELSLLEVPGFEILARIAAGGAGVVYRARQASPSREVALKVLRLDTLAPGQVARFQREAEILGTLNHPCIAHVYGAGVLHQADYALPWIAMELVHGVSLDQYVDTRHDRTSELLALFIELCGAVDHAHERGIVHRDLKPSNVLVDAHGTPHVLDFGVAKILGDADARYTHTGALVGTIAYMAPEQARGEQGSIGAAVDVYALGVMLYEAFTGTPPLRLDGLGVMEAAHRVCFAEPVPLSRMRPDLPPDLDAIVGKALEKESHRRYARAADLAADIENLLANRPVRARRPTTIDQARKFVRRHRVVTISSAVVVVALSIALAVSLVALRNQSHQRALTSDTIDYFATRMTAFSTQLGLGEEQRADLEEVATRTSRQLLVDPGSRALRATLAQTLYQLAELDSARSNWVSTLSRLDTALAIREALVEDDHADHDSRAHISAICARIGEAWRARGDLVRRDEWFARAFAIDEGLARECPDDPEFLEDLGWSLERVAQTAIERGDRAEAERLSLRRLDDARKLYALDPTNWKFTFNLSHAHGMLAAQHAMDADPRTSIDHARECVRLARITLGMDPERRDFVSWLAHASSNTAEMLRRAGMLPAARSHAEVALLLAEKLARTEPTRPAHLGFVVEASQRFASPDMGEPCRDRVTRAVECLHRVSEAAARFDVPSRSVDAALEELLAGMSSE